MVSKSFTFRYLQPWGNIRGKVSYIRETNVDWDAPAPHFHIILYPNSEMTLCVKQEWKHKIKLTHSRPKSVTRTHHWRDSVQNSDIFITLGVRTLLGVFGYMYFAPSKGDSITRITSSSAIAKRPRCRVGQLSPKVEDRNWETIFTDIIGLSSTTVTHLASKETDIGEKIRTITLFNVIQGHRGRYRSKARMRLPISD